jgi:hypothetical protein
LPQTAAQASPDAAAATRQKPSTLCQHDHVR